MSTDQYLEGRSRGRLGALVVNSERNLELDFLTRGFLGGAHSVSMVGKVITSELEVGRGERELWWENLLPDPRNNRSSLLNSDTSRVGFLDLALAQGTV